MFSPLSISTLYLVHQSPKGDGTKQRKKPPYDQGGFAFTTIAPPVPQ
jgi:hypothetical protein